MNTYQVKQVNFDDKKGDKIPEPTEVQGQYPEDAYRNYLMSIDSEFNTIQEDNIGTLDNPCVRFISIEKETKKKFLFYVKKQL